jgi:hypothetical protein
MVVVTMTIESSRLHRVARWQGLLVSISITIASVFQLCIEAFDLVKAGRSQELELQKVVLRLNIEKCRLYTSDVNGLDMDQYGSTST